MPAKYNFGYNIEMVGCSGDLNAMIKYFIGFDLIVKKMTREETNDQKL